MAEHGGNIPLSWTDFSISVNPYHPDFFRNYENELSNLSQRYIYFEDIEKTLESIIGHKIFLTAGTTETLYVLNMAFKNNIVVEKGSYSEYERTARLFGKEVFKVDSVVQSNIKDCLVFLNNPKNPTGRFYTYPELKDFTEQTIKNNSIPVIDDAFMDFIPDIPGWEKNWVFDGAIHMRTYTKSYGLAGIRTGYFIDPYKKMHRFRPPWSIGSIGRLFMQKLIEDDGKFLKTSMQKLNLERQRLNGLLGTQFISPFFLIKVKEKTELLEKLSQNHMMVRDTYSFGLKDHIRFSVKTPEENNRLISILDEYIEKIPGKAGNISMPT